MARQQKKKPQRAFGGYSLRNADVFDNPTRAQNHKVLVAEAAAKENVRIESLEGWEDAEAPAAFQPHSFDEQTARHPEGVAPEARSHKERVLEYNRLFYDFGISAAGSQKVAKPGFQILPDKGASFQRNPRRKTPWWLRAPWKQPDIVKEFEKLDYELLRAFYLGHYSDEDIFEENRLVFEHEAKESGRKRFLSSANAVTRHRLDLVDEGNKLWGAKDPDDAKPESEDDDLNPYGFFAAGQVIPEGFGSIPCVVRGCHSYHVVPLEESGIFRPSGWYICANHGDRTQKRFVRYKALALSKLRVKP